MNIPNTHPADAFLVLKAQIADLEIRAKVEHARLVAMGLGHHDGEVARATVGIVENRTKVDWQKIAEALKPSLRLPRDRWSEQMDELVTGFTTPLDPYFRVGVVARKG